MSKPCFSIKFTIFASALVTAVATYLIPANAESRRREVTIAVVGPMSGLNARFGEQPTGVAIQTTAGFRGR